MTGSVVAAGFGAQNYQQNRQQFLNAVFAGEIPKPRVLWLNKNTRQQTEKILGHKVAFLRLRYWRKDQQSVWILQEIGKEKPISIGFSIKNGTMDQVRVLAYRESRGWEITQDFFLRQFQQIHLDNQLQLHRNIQGITGATLSVRAIKKLARLALYYHQLVVAR